MSRHTENAERCLIATCAHLSLTVVRDDNFHLWIGVLTDILPDCDSCAAALAGVRDAADRVVYPPVSITRETALSRLRHEVQQYYVSAAAARHDAWKTAKGGGE